MLHEDLGSLARGCPGTWLTSYISVDGGNRPVLPELYWGCPHTCMCQVFQRRLALVQLWLHQKQTEVALAIHINLILASPHGGRSLGKSISWCQVSER